MISMPVAVCAGNFWMQLDLFWYQHKKIYGFNAHRKALALVINKNQPNDTKHTKLPWDIDVPYAMTDSCFDFLNIEINVRGVLKQKIKLQYEENRYFIWYGEFISRSVHCKGK